jgi:N-acyl homoserine lactone hydrolase
MSVQVRRGVSVKQKGMTTPMGGHEFYLLHLGRMGWLDEAGEKHYGQVPGYLIRTAGGQTVLVDTGSPAALIGQETAAPWSPLLNDTRPEDDLAPRLAALDLAPADIDLLISTHFDFDHCGRHELFAGAGITSLVQRDHLEFARADPRCDPALFDLAGIDYAPVDGEMEIEPGLRLIPTPGHIPGLQSLFVDAVGGPVVLAIDAIALAGHAEPINPADFGHWYPDAEAAAQSRERLLALAEETGAFVLFGHDWPQWETLPKSPAPFRRP